MTRDDLIECVEVLEVMAAHTSREKRMTEVERLTDEYIEANGYPPDGGVLERLSNVILHEELTDPHPDKMSRKITADMSEDEKRRHEYPIMSDRMYEARVSGDQRRRRKDGTTIIEVPLAQARNMGLDGKNYNLPVRRIKK